MFYCAFVGHLQTSADLCRGDPLKINSSFGLQVPLDTGNLLLFFGLGKIAPGLRSGIGRRGPKPNSPTPGEERYQKGYI